MKNIFAFLVITCVGIPSFAGQQSNQSSESIDCIDAKIERLEASKVLLTFKSNGMSALCDGRSNDICMEMRKVEEAMRVDLGEAIRREVQICE